MHDVVIRGGTVVDGSGGATVHADVAIDDGLISEIGQGVTRGRREVDAYGLAVTPGWIDIHTHYDGQALWDPDLTPSSWHGVTTAVMGNCGVGFAPVRPGGAELLVEIMESVEDIPSETLHAALDWSWESFGDYIDALAAQPRTIELATLVPHIALRAYVMGERAHDEVATPDDIVQMSALAEAALKAGACGISTSRSPVHASRHGYVPGTYASRNELFGFAEAIRRAGHGVFQLLSDKRGNAEDRDWMVDFVRHTGTTLTYILSQTGKAPTAYRDSLAAAAADLAAGVPIVPQVASRPVGTLLGLDCTLHPFVTSPTWKRLEGIPRAERIAALLDADLRAAMIAEPYDPEDLRIRSRVRMGTWQRWDMMFRLGDPPDYEPEASKSVTAAAAATGRSPADVALDWMLDRDGRGLIFSPSVNYVDGNHDVLRELITHPATITGLSDAGAHCSTICDASVQTHMLSHWVQGRVRGERLSLQEAVELQTGRPARLFGFTDRGVLAPGKRADVNIIDVEGLAIDPPEMIFDLPAGGQRLVQRAHGYVATFVRGITTLEHDELTGARPAGVVRPTAAVENG